MKLYVIRHAIAAEAEPGTSDAERALTDEGRARFEDAVRGLDKLEVRIDLLLHSPLLRAVQTAELLVPLLEDGGETRVAAELAQTPAQALLTRLEGERAAVVGHEPWLSELVALLVAGKADLASAFELKKGAVAVLEGEPAAGAMTLVALHPPSLLRELGG